MVKALRYCENNEAARVIRIVHFTDDLATVPENFTSLVDLLSEIFPRFRIDVTIRQGEFNPWAVKEVVEGLGASEHSAFIGCPGEEFPFKLSDFGGLRIITSHAALHRYEEDYVAQAELDGEAQAAAPHTPVAAAAAAAAAGADDVRVQVAAETPTAPALNVAPVSDPVQASVDAAPAATVAAANGGAEADPCLSLLDATSLPQK